MCNRAKPPKLNHASPSLITRANRRRVLIALALIVLTIGTYIPSIFNGFIWDDPAYVVNNPMLRDLDGLWKIWTDPLATPQYYPMVHTTFWIEAQLWGTKNPMGFHIDNILLHALAVVLLWRALAMLKIPWPGLAAAVFAVHPVMVESVSWVTERKNVLSIVFYLLAFRAYWRAMAAPDAHPGLHRRRWYFLSLALFLLALWSKTVTCSLPAAIALMIWWKRGKLTLADFKPLLPMFIIGLVMAVVTGHLEKTHVGASGPDFAWTPIDRCLIAGHAICFYAGKIVWPHPLLFMYPLWDLHAHRAMQFIYPIAVTTIAVALWLLRNKLGRGPLAAVLFFIGTLVPALGFVNVYPMRYSFVADHFQYLASIGLIVLIVAGLCRLTRIIPPPVISILILAPLVFLTVHQQQQYKNEQTLWETELAQYEPCWMAHVNLAGVYDRAKRFDDAMKQTQRALELAPDEADTRYDMGVAMAERKRWPEARDWFLRATVADAHCAPAWSYLALVRWDGLATDAERGEAVVDAKRALSLDPNLPAAHLVLGKFDLLCDNPTAALTEFHAALNIDPDNMPAHAESGAALLQLGHPEQAAGEFLKVVEHDPKDVGGLTNLAKACALAGRPNEAADYYHRALGIEPGYEPAKTGLKEMMSAKTRIPK